MPNNCKELLPDYGPYLDFYDQVAMGLMAQDRKLAKKLLEIRAMRDLIVEKRGVSLNENPIDILIRKTLCFYRDTFEPLKVVPYDDADFISFLRKSVHDLKAKTDKVVYEMQLEKYQDLARESKLKAGKASMALLSQEARKQAEESFEKISRSAKSKVNRSRD